MKSPSQRRLAVAAVLLAPALGACGFNVQTDQVYQAAVGVNDRSGSVDILNAVIVTAKDGSGTFAGTLVNNTGTAAQLREVTGEGITAAFAAGKPVEVEGFGFNNLGAAGETVPPVKLGLSGPTEAIVPGTFVELTFTFASGQETSLQVPVVGVNEDYESVPLPAPARDTSTKPTGDEPVGPVEGSDASPSAE